MNQIYILMVIKLLVTNQRNPIDIHWEQSGAELDI